MPRLFSHERYIWDYTSPVAELLVLMKVRPSYALALWFGKALATFSKTHFSALAPHFVCPVPTSRNRVLKRGFSQSHILAQHVAQSLKLPLLDCLLHSGRGSPQSELPFALRIRNMQRNISLHVSIPLVGKRVLLIDDVTTSGATAHSAALQLLRAGAHSISLLTVARSRTWLSARSSIYQVFVRGQDHMLHVE